MKPEPVRLFTFLWVAIAAMLVGLVGLTVFVHTATLRLDATDRKITEDSAPSILALEEANLDLARLQILVRDRLRTPDDGAAPAEHIVQARRALGDSLAKYFSYPLDPGEAEIQADITRGKRRLDQVVESAAATSPASAPQVKDRLRTELDVAAGAVDADLLRAAQLNAQVQYEASAVLRSVRRTLLPVAVGFEGVSMLAAVVAIGAAYRVSRDAQHTAAEHRRLLEQRADELDAFSGRVAHDLVSPLATVSLAVGMAEQRLASTDDAGVRRMLSRAGSTLQRVQRLVTDLLEFARAAAEPPPGASTEVAPLMQRLVADLEPLAAEANVDLALAGSSERRVRCAEGILSSVLSNLVQNAVRMTSTVAVRHVVVRAGDDGPDVRFEVEDTGPGIAPEDLSVIFEPYVSRGARGSGLGLGLATVKRFAETHGGQVGVRSELGHGALFWVTLPAVRQGRIAAAREGLDRSGDGAPSRSS